MAKKTAQKPEVHYNLLEETARNEWTVFVGNCSFVCYTLEQAELVYDAIEGTIIRIK